MTPQRWAFLVPLAIFTACCGVALYGMLALLGVPLTVHFAGILLFFAAFTGLLHAWQEHAFGADPKGFVRRFMAALMGKMFLSLVILVVLLITLPAALTVPVALSFALLYLAFLVFSTVRLMRLGKSTPQP